MGLRRKHTVENFHNTTEALEKPPLGPDITAVGVQAGAINTLPIGRMPAILIGILNKTCESQRLSCKGSLHRKMTPA